MSIYNL